MISVCCRGRKHFHHCKTKENLIIILLVPKTIIAPISLAVLGMVFVENIILTLHDQSTLDKPRITCTILRNIFCQTVNA